MWTTDITYIPLESGWGYLVAIIDWYSRAVLGWRLSKWQYRNQEALQPSPAGLVATRVGGGVAVVVSVVLVVLALTH